MMNPAGAEKLFFQGFPLDRLKVAHLTSNAPWLDSETFPKVLFQSFNISLLNTISGDAFACRKCIPCEICGSSICLWPFNLQLGKVQ